MENLKLFVAGYYDVYEQSTYSEVDIYTLEEILKLSVVEGVVEYYTKKYMEAEEKTWEELSFDQKSKYIHEYCEKNGGVFGLEYFEDEEQAKSSFEKYKKEIDCIEDDE